MTDNISKKTSSMTQILIAGYFGFGNCGDEAILAGMLTELEREIPECSFMVVSGNPHRTTSDHGVPAVPWEDLEQLATSVDQSDLVLLGGGGLLQDYWAPDTAGLMTPGFHGLASYVTIPWLAHLLGIPCMLYALGVGPLQTEVGRQLVRGALHICQATTVRDQFSLESLRRLIPEGSSRVQDIEVTADPAFSLIPLPHEKESRHPHGLNLPESGPLICVSLRAWAFGIEQSTWERSIAQALDLHLDQSEGSVLFLPMQVHSDRPHEHDAAVAWRVQRAMRFGDRCTLLHETLTPTRALELISRCGLVLAMRMHTALFAILSGRPVVGLCYDPKVYSLLQAADLGRFAIEPSDWNPRLICSRMFEALELTNLAALSGFSQKMQDRTRANARLAAGLLKSASPPELPSRSILGRIAVDKFLHAARLEGAQSILTERIVALQQQLSQSRAESRDLEQQLSILRTKSRDLEHQLHSLRATRGVRLLSWYWEKVRMIFPEGGRARVLFRRIMPRPTPLDRSYSTVVEAPSETWEHLAIFSQRPWDPGKAAFVFFSATQLLEAEGQRTWHLAFELAGRGHPVVFVYWRWSADELQPQEHIERGILQVPFDYFIREPSHLITSFKDRDRVALIGFPHPSLFAPLAEAHGQGWMAVYDAVDDWSQFHTVGQAPWYDEAFERHLARSSDAVFAVGPVLLERTRELGSHQPSLLPNGFGPGFEQVETTVDLKRGDVTIGYFGYLSSAWFDWDLMIDLAKAEPSWRLYLIGYGETGRPRRLPANLILLGKQPRRMLSSFARNWDVAIIPFKQGPLAEAADPIKTYEYLGLGLPVVACGVRPPLGAESLVEVVSGLQELRDKIISLSGIKGSDADARQAYARSCSWAKRVDLLVGAISRGEQRIAEKRSLFREGI